MHKAAREIVQVRREVLKLGCHLWLAVTRWGRPVKRTRIRVAPIGSISCADIFVLNYLTGSVNQWISCCLNEKKKEGLPINLVLIKKQKRWKHKKICLAFHMFVIWRVDNKHLISQAVFSLKKLKRVKILKRKKLTLFDVLNLVSSPPLRLLGTGAVEHPYCTHFGASKKNLGAPSIFSMLHAHP